MLWPHRWMRILKSNEMSIIKIRNSLGKIIYVPCQLSVLPYMQARKMYNFPFIHSEGLRSHRNIANRLRTQHLWAIPVPSYSEFSFQCCQKQELIICAGNSTTSALCFDCFCHVWLVNLIAGHRKLHLCQEHSEQINVGGNQARSIVIRKTSITSHVTHMSSCNSSVSKHLPGSSPQFIS